MESNIFVGGYMEIRVCSGKIKGYGEKVDFEEKTMLWD